MNERIEELAEQADKWSAEEYHQLFLANESPNGQKLFREKFAELIVRECMEVARPFYMGTPADSVYYVEQAINRIAEHFGVEE